MTPGAGESTADLKSAAASPWWMQRRVRLAAHVTLATLLIAAAGIAIGRTLRARHHNPPAAVTEQFLPRPLQVTADFKRVAAPLLAPIPVSIAPWRDSRFLVCNYAVLQEVDIATGVVGDLPPPTDVSHWVPTGVCTHPEEDRVFVANYTGHDVLEMRRDADGLHLERRFVHPDMKSPENVSLSPDRRYVAVADYDGNRLWVFRRDGALEWSREIPLAHGVAFGADFVVVTSLGDCTICKFDLAGNLLRRTGSPGWGDEKYLWPTCIFLHGDRLLVSDAHTGKISALDLDLRQREWIGGNGPHPALFNMPYAIGGKPGALLVCDTFKRRILVLEENFHCRQVLVGEARLDRPWNAPNLDAISWRRRKNESTPRDLHLPGLPPGEWFCDYGHYDLAVDSRTITVNYPPSGGLFAGSFPYFCWCGEVTYKNDAYVLLGHSQNPTFLVVDARGRCVPQRVESGESLWQTNRGLVTDEGVEYDPSPLLRQAAARFAHHDGLQAKGWDPLDAMREAYWPEFTREKLDSALNAAFVSARGKTFWTRWRAAKNARERAHAIAEFDAPVERAAHSTVLLEELFLRNMLAPRP